jgi:hypothetical protein
MENLCDMLLTDEKNSLVVARPKKKTAEEFQIALGATIVESS